MVDFPTSLSNHNAATQEAVIMCGQKIIFLLALLTLVSSSAIAQLSGGQFAITESTIDNGGGVSTGAQFLLMGTIGQPDAALQAASGGNFALQGGFWAGGAGGPADQVIFADGFENP